MYRDACHRPCPGELWVRWGVDGVPRWSISYVTLTVALCGEHQHFKMHSVEPEVGLAPFGQKAQFRV